MSLINVQDLAIGHHEILAEGISFTLAEGDILAIKGKNGSGKTTLIKTLQGMIPPLKGIIEKGQDLVYLPQNTSIFNHFSLTLGEMLNCFDLDKAFYELFEKDILNLRWRDASGGQRQKVLILSRMIKNAHLVILDEPFNHLDQNSIKIVCEFLKKAIDKRLIKALIIVSHIDSDHELKTTQVIHL